MCWALPCIEFHFIDLRPFLPFAKTIWLPALQSACKLCFPTWRKSQILKCTFYSIMLLINNINNSSTIQHCLLACCSALSLSSLGTRAVSTLAQETGKTWACHLGNSSALKTGGNAHCPMLSLLLLPASGIRTSCLHPQSKSCSHVQCAHMGMLNHKLIVRTQEGIGLAQQDCWRSDYWKCLLREFVQLQLMLARDPAEQLKERSVQSQVAAHSWPCLQWIK